MRHDAVDWIRLLAITIALHGLHHGFQPVYPSDVVALAVIVLVLAYCIWDQHSSPANRARRVHYSARCARLGSGASIPADLRAHPLPRFPKR